MIASVAVLLLFAARPGSPPSPASGAPRDVETAAIAATLAYRDAWLTNRRDAVMATLAPDAVLLPSGMAPVEGADAIRRFFWPPDGPATTVTAMEQTVDEVLGEGGLAVVRGHGSLTFTFGKGGELSSHTQRHRFVNVVRRQRDGRWRIVRRMWSDSR